MISSFEEAVKELLQADYKLMLDTKTGELGVADPEYREKKKGNMHIIKVQDMSMVDWVVLVRKLIEKIYELKKEK